MIELKVRMVENSLGVILPEELADRLKIHDGDSLYLMKLPEGYRLTSYSPEVARQMEIAKLVMQQYKEALGELAR